MVRKKKTRRLFMIADLAAGPERGFCGVYGKKGKPTRPS